VQEKLTEAQIKIKKELMNMAFAEAQIDKAIAKANPTTLKIEEVVEIII
jgi:hypothetical protein